MVNMKIVVESYTETSWVVYEHMFGSHCNLGYARNINDALIMANNLSKRKWIPIEFRIQASTGDEEEQVHSHYLHSDTDVLQAILTYCQ
jgi:hypothetical protein